MKIRLPAQQEGTIVGALACGAIFLMLRQVVTEKLSVSIWSMTAS